MSLGLFLKEDGDVLGETVPDVGTEIWEIAKAMRMKPAPVMDYDCLYYFGKIPICNNIDRNSRR